MFQSDIFPPCPSEEPALTAEEWIGGVDKDPKLKPFGPEGQTVTSGGPKVSMIVFEVVELVSIVSGIYRG